MLLWINEIAWFCEIIRRVMFNAKKGQDSMASAIEYIRDDFLFDLIATLP